MSLNNSNSSKAKDDRKNEENADNDIDNQLELHWSPSSSSDSDCSSTSSSKQLSLSPTKYEDYEEQRNKHSNRSLANTKQASISLIRVEFSKGPLIEIKSFEDAEAYQDEIDSMKVLHEHYLQKQHEYLSNTHRFVKTFDLSKEQYLVLCSNMQRISWQLCQTRRSFQQSVQYLTRYLSIIKPTQFDLQQLDLLGCVCLRLAAKHNQSRYQIHADSQIKRDDFNATHYLKILENMYTKDERIKHTRYDLQQFNRLECAVLQTLRFELNYPTVYDFIVYHIEMLLLNIEREPDRRYYQSLYLRPSVVLKIFQIIDHVLLDLQSVYYLPSVIATCLLKCCFNFENWQQALSNISNRNASYMPNLSTPTPTPSPFGCYAKLSGQILDQQQEKCNRLVCKYLTMPTKYWQIPPNVFQYEKVLKRNILTYQTWLYS